LLAKVTAPPCDQPDHIVVVNVGDQLVRPEAFEQQFEAMLVVLSIFKMLAYLGPVSTEDVIKP
jgi:hypothetical protein